MFCRNKWEWLELAVQAESLVKLSAEAGKAGQECLWQWVELVKLSVGADGFDFFFSIESTKAGEIGQRFCRNKWG